MLSPEDRNAAADNCFQAAEYLRKSFEKLSKSADPAELEYYRQVRDCYLTVQRTALALRRD